MRTISALLFFFSIINCGSNKSGEEALPEYTGQEIDASISWCEGGNPAPAYCEDGSICKSCRANSLNNLGMITKNSSCIRLGITSVSDPNAGTACRTMTNDDNQVEAGALIQAKRIILSTEPFSLATNYSCSTNTACSADSSSFHLALSIDQNTKHIDWSDDGATASAEFMRLINVLRGVGL